MQIKSNQTYNKLDENIDNAKNIVCSVCIASYKRPELLRKLIQSLFVQQGLENFNLEIIIVDNDVDKTAKPIVDEFAPKKDITVSYFNQPIKNISLTRNMGLENSNGDYIAIIDDDETADEFWIYNLIKSLNDYSAGVVFGYVIPVFYEDAPDWLKQREIFFKPVPETGSKPYFYYTTNCMIRSSVIKENNIYFDPGHGLTGGEDGVFFRALSEKFKIKFITSREAKSYEFVPKERMKLKYIFSRYLQIGILYAKLKKGDKNNLFFFKWIALFLKFIIAFLVYFVKSLILFPYKKKWIFSYISLCASIGKISGMFNLTHQHYNK